MRVKGFCRPVWRFQSDGSRGVGAARGMLAAAVGLVACGCLASGAVAASPHVVSPSSTTLTAAFVPNKLDVASTMEVGVQIHRPAGETPPPLIGMELNLPAGVSLTTSELGLDTCDAATLTRAGPMGCKPDSVMGYGNAMVLAPDAVEALSSRSLSPFSWRHPKIATPRCCSTEMGVTRRLPRSCSSVKCWKNRGRSGPIWIQQFHLWRDCRANRIQLW